jgi:hypothetical protein
MIMYSFWVLSNWTGRYVIEMAMFWFYINESLGFIFSLFWCGSLQIWQITLIDSVKIITATNCIDLNIGLYSTSSFEDGFVDLNCFLILLLVL